MKRIILFLILILFSNFALAYEVKVFHNESMPFCGTIKGHPTGMAIEILNEISNHGGPKFKFESLPWARAQLHVQQQKGTAIIPLTRTPEREAKHFWISKLFSHTIRLTICKNPTKKAELPSPFTIESAKDLRIGIIRSSAIIPYLKNLGFNELQEIKTAEQNAIMLSRGYIAAIAESQWVDTYHWRLLGMNPGDLVIGPQIGKTHYIYLAAALDFPIETAEKIRTAMNRLSQNGHLKKILDKWN